MQRRDFLSWLLKAAAVALGIEGLATLPYLYHSRKLGPLRYVKAADEEKIPRRGVRQVDFSFAGMTRKIFIVRMDRELFVLSPTCSHLGCMVNWNYLKQEFDCPCHGGRYDMAGRVIGGPPPKPLARLPYEIKNGSLYVGVRA
ncbi:MAG: ubiquinol-cytochrome c reductase iron-sulfur subunit [Nitrospiraceae bacterium]|nr:ubiquinol-cytochrome c reductase iron-sulfur subunit [Nitrospiraceae bacterium]